MIAIFLGGPLDGKVKENVTCSNPSIKHTYIADELAPVGVVQTTKKSPVFNITRMYKHEYVAAMYFTDGAVFQYVRTIVHETIEFVGIKETFTREVKLP